jgi:hypothetical protein
VCSPAQLLQSVVDPYGSVRCGALARSDGGLIRSAPLAVWLPESPLTCSW